MCKDICKAFSAADNAHAQMSSSAVLLTRQGHQTQKKGVQSGPVNMFLHEGLKRNLLSCTELPIAHEKIDQI